MGDDDDGFPGMTPGQLLEKRQYATANVAIQLTTGVRVLEVAAIQCSLTGTHRHCIVKMIELLFRRFGQTAMAVSEAPPFRHERPAPRQSQQDGERVPSLGSLA